MARPKSVSPIAGRLPYIGVAFTVILNAASIGYTYGAVSYRLMAAEAGLVKLEKSQDNFRELATDMAVVKNQLVAIGATLIRLETGFTNAKASGK